MVHMSPDRDQSLSLVAVTQEGRNGDSDMMELTCRNHTGARYLTKRIPGRSLHFIRADGAYVQQVLRETQPDQAERLAGLFTPNQLGQMYNFGPYECPCPLSDLIEVK